MEAQGTPAGWYQNPEGPGQRYWDGTQWTDSYSQGAQHQLQLTLEPEAVVAGDNAVAVVSLPDGAGPCTVTLAYTMTCRPPAQNSAGSVLMGRRQTQTVEVAAGESDAAVGVLHMDLPIPIEGPPTAYDRDDSIEWFVEARAGDHQAAARLTVLSVPELHSDWADGIHREGEPLQSLTVKRMFLAEELPSERRPPHPPECFMRIELPSGSAALGETLSGSLLLRPEEPVRARSVRVELGYLRVEVQDLYVVPETGPTVSTVVLAQDRELAGDGEEVAFPFEITVPAHGPPSFLTPHNHLHWNLMAIVDRRFGFDFVTHIELNVHSEPVVGEAREERLRELVGARAQRAAEAEQEASARQPTPPDGPPPSVRDLKRRFGRMDWRLFSVEGRLSALVEDGESVYDIALATKGVLDGVESKGFLVVASDRRVLLVKTDESDSFVAAPYSELSQATMEGPTSVRLHIPSGPVQLEMNNEPARRIVGFLALRAGLSPDPLLSG